MNRCHLLVFATAVLLTLPVAPARGSCPVSPTGIALHATQDLAKTIICPSAVDSLECDMTTYARLGENYRVLVVAIDLPRGISSEPSGALELEVGIDYNGTLNEGVDILSWSSCSDLSIPENNWPEPGGGHVFQYNSCQLPREGRVDLILGWFQVYAHSQDGLQLTDLGYREDRFPRLTACDQTEQILDPLRLGSVAFRSSGGSGWDPCTDFADSFPGPCCLPDSCDAYEYYICCELAGGTRLPYYNTCEDCGVLPTMPSTWGRIKSIYEN